MRRPPLRGLCDALNASIAAPLPAAKLFGQVDTPDCHAPSRALEASDVPDPPSLAALLPVHTPRAADSGPAHHRRGEIVVPAWPVLGVGPVAAVVAGDAGAVAADVLGAPFAPGVGCDEEHAAPGIGAAAEPTGSGSGQHLDN